MRLSKRSKKILLNFAWWLAMTTTYGQELSLPLKIKSELESMGIAIAIPLDAGYELRQFKTDEFQPCLWGITSRREHLQIRYYFEPYRENEPITTTPNVTVFRLLTHLATNADEAIISVIQPPKDTLQHNFNADWGVICFFQPKPAFSDWPFCKMLALYKEGKGTAIVFFLFKEPDNPALDSRQAAVWFR